MHSLLTPDSTKVTFSLNGENCIYFVRPVKNKYLYALTGAIQITNHGHKAMHGVQNNSC